MKRQHKAINKEREQREEEEQRNWRLPKLYELKSGQLYRNTIKDVNDDISNNRYYLSENLTQNSTVAYRFF